MGPSKMSPRAWLVYFCLTLIFFFTIAFQLFDGEIWVLVGAVALVPAVAVVAYLARPSVREVLGLYFIVYRGNRATIRGDFAGAERHYARAVARAETSTYNHDSLMGTALSHLAEVFRNKGHLADAEPMLLRALRHAEQAARRASTGAVTLWRMRETLALNLAAVYINRGRYAEAEPLCREALAALKSDPAAAEEVRAVAEHNLAQVFAGRGQYAEAENLVRQALDRVARRINRNRVSPAFWIILASLADLCRRQGNLDEAELLARQALALAEKSIYGPKHPHLSRYLNVLAETVRQQGHLGEAESLCLRSQALTEKAFGPDHFRLDGCLAPLARIRAAQGRFGEAEALLRRCVLSLEPAVVAEHPDRLARREEYAALLRQLDRADEAQQWKAPPKPLPVCELVQDQYFRV